MGAECFGPRCDACGRRSLTLAKPGPEPERRTQLFGMRARARTRKSFRRCRCLTHGRFFMLKKLVLETTAPFQGLAELVAYDEGLFEKEGLTIEWADREKGVDKTP